MAISVLLLELRVGPLTPRPVRRHPLPDLGANQDEGGGPVGKGGSEQQGQRATLGRAHQRRPLAADSVHHRAQVVHSLLECADLDTVGQPHSSLVEPDHPSERRQTFHPTAIRRLFPHDPQVGEVALDQYKV